MRKVLIIDVLQGAVRETYTVPYWGHRPDIFAAIMAMTAVQFA